MKASKLIDLLNNIVKEHGDLEVAFIAVSKFGADYEVGNVTNVDFDPYFNDRIMVYMDGNNLFDEIEEEVLEQARGRI